MQAENVCKVATPPSTIHTLSLNLGKSVKS